MESMIADNINSELFVSYGTNSALSGDGNLNFDTRLQANAGLNCKFNTFLKERREKGILTICLTTSLEACKSIKRLWILSS